MNKRAKRYPKLLTVPLTTEQADELAHARVSHSLNIAALCRELLFNALRKYKALDEEPATQRRQDGAATAPTTT